ncbi:MAG: hypothetical protein M0Z83_00865 [Betaproteobacteria bacterium]|nr:hypothetical protein [Betaproteobacteria bacterium]
MNLVGSEIDDAIVALLIRMRRFGAQVSLRTPRLQKHSDLPFLRIFWACSSKVQALAEYLIRNPHEASAVLQFERRSDTGMIRGRLNARETAIRQITSGNPTLFVSLEAVRSYATGPNHLVIWVLEEARRLGREILRTSSQESKYSERFGQVTRLLEDAGRLEGIRIATMQIETTRRPSSPTISQAKRARARLYQLAADAYLSLLAIEQGDEAQICAVLQENLLGPLEIWKRFELYVAVAMGESLARVLGVPCNLSPSFDQDGMLISIGDYRIYWQAQTEYFTTPELEPSENKVRDILMALGMGSGWDRPDVIVVNSAAQQVVAIAEVKYFTGESNDGRAALRAAIDQLVRYARGYRREMDWDGLLGHSLAVPVLCDFAAEPRTFGVPWVFDFNSIQSQALDQWSRALNLASIPSPALSPLAA